MFEKRVKQKTIQRHQPTFMKQLIYFIIMLSFNLWLTIHTVLRMDDGMTIVDETGRVHDLSVATVRTMIGTGWGAFIAAWLLNIAFYKVHPSAVDLEVSRFRNKMVINVLGEQKRIMKAAKEEDETIEGVVIIMETQD